MLIYFVKKGLYCSYYEGVFWIFMVRSIRFERGKWKELYVLYIVVFNGKIIIVIRCVINGWLIYIDSIFVYCNIFLLYLINFIFVLIYF